MKVWTVVVCLFILSLTSCEEDCNCDNTENFDPKEGLIAYWSFDDSTAKDHSGFGNDGQVMNEVKFVSGKSGTAAELFGMITNSGEQGGHILLPAISFEKMSEFSLSLWIYEKTPHHSHGEVYLFFGEVYTGWIGIAHAGNTTDTTRFIGYNSTFNPPLQYPFDYNLRNQWVHYALVYNHGVLKGYSQGVKVVEGIRKVHIETDNAAIGRQWWNNSTSTRAEFIVDEVRIYNKALSDNEIFLLAN